MINYDSYIFDIPLPIYLNMAKNNFKVHEENGQITLIELDNMINFLPVSDEVYLRVINCLADQGLVKLPVQSKTCKTRS